MTTKAIKDFLAKNVATFSAGISNSVLEDLPDDLSWLYGKANGFYAFGGALLFRPYSSSDDPLGIVQWNDFSLWKNSYPVDLRNMLFFAEDVFGYQFGRYLDGRSGIVRLDPETGALENISRNVMDLLMLIVGDPGEYSGDVFLYAMKKAGKELYAGDRIVPKVPFVCGGSFDIQNFAILKDVTSMCIRGELATKIKDVPEGETIIFRIVD